MRHIPRGGPVARRYRGRRPRCAAGGGPVNPGWRGRERRRPGSAPVLDARRRRAV